VQLRCGRAGLESLRRACLFLQNLLQELFQSLRASGMGSMERGKASSRQLHSQRCSSSMNIPSEADGPVAFAIDMNIETSATCIAGHGRI
jgi:hypothetical protein